MKTLKQIINERNGNNNIFWKVINKHLKDETQKYINLFIESEIKDILEGLKLKRIDKFEDYILHDKEDGYNQAVDELNQKIEEILNG